MKKIYKHYLVFYPRLYSLIVLILLPIAVAGVCFLTPLGNLGSIGVILVQAILSLVHLFADYFVFNGICNKSASFRLLKSSKKGYGVLKGGVILDQVIRFANILFCTLETELILNYIKADEYSMPIAVAVLFAMVTYTLVTATLILIRYIDGAMVYGQIISLASVVIIAAIVGLFLLWLSDTFTLGLIYLIVCAALVISTFFGYYAVIRSYKKSFE